MRALSSVGRNFTFSAWRKEDLRNVLTLVFLANFAVASTLPTQAASRPAPAQVYAQSFASCAPATPANVGIPMAAPDFHGADLVNRGRMMFAMMPTTVNAGRVLPLSPAQWQQAKQAHDACRSAGRPAGVVPDCPPSGCCPPPDYQKTTGSDGGYTVNVWQDYCNRYTRQSTYGPNNQALPSGTATLTTIANYQGQPSIHGYQDAFPFGNTTVTAVVPSPSSVAYNEGTWLPVPGAVYLGKQLSMYIWPTNNQGVPVGTVTIPFDSTGDYVNIEPVGSDQYQAILVSHGTVTTSPVETIPLIGGRVRSRDGIHPDGGVWGNMACLGFTAVFVTDLWIAGETGGIGAPLVISGFGDMAAACGPVFLDDYDILEY
jgi:hypothetical protein